MVGDLCEQFCGFGASLCHEIIEDDESWNNTVELVQIWNSLPEMNHVTKFFLQLWLVLCVVPHYFMRWWLNHFINVQYDTFHQLGFSTSCWSGANSCERVFEWKRCHYEFH